MDSGLIMLAWPFALCVAAAVNLWVAYGNLRNARRNAVIARGNLASATRAVEAGKARVAALKASLIAMETGEWEDKPFSVFDSTRGRFEERGPQLPEV